MAVFSSPPSLSDWLKSESNTGNYYSRDEIVVASGQGKLTTGTVLAQLTASGKYVVAAATGSDGSQTAIGVLIAPVDATSADAPGILLARSAVVSHNALVWGAAINSAPLRAAAVLQLKAKGIIDRQTA